MAKINFGNWDEAGRPRWASRPRDADTLVPGGAMLDEAAFAAGDDGRKLVVSGTVVGQTYAEMDAGAGFHPAAALDEIVRIVAFDVYDASDEADFVMYKPGTEVKENHLPQVMDESLAQEVLALVRKTYVTQRGAA